MRSGLLIFGFFIATVWGQYLDGEVGALEAAAVYCGIAVADGIHMLVREFKRFNDRAERG